MKILFELFEIMFIEKLKLMLLNSLGDLGRSRPINSIRIHIHILLYILFTTGMKKYEHTCQSQTNVNVFRVLCT
jgi:hypothetical protein